MTREGEPQEQNGQSGFQEIIKARPLTHGEFYLAMTERPDPQGLGLRPELRSLFVGQERAYRQLYDAITESLSGTVIAITAPFGAGKDALFDAVIADLIDQGKIKGEEAQRVHIDYDLEEGKSFEETKRGFSWVAKPENPQSINPKVLAVNEVAYGWSFNTKESLQKQLGVAGKFLGKEVPVMVLLGDYALEDSEIVGAVGSPNEPKIIKLDPLTPDILKNTLRRRLAYSLERSPEEIDVDAMLDPEFLTALVPNTEYPIATMRSSLAVLESIGRKLKPTEEPLRISKELAREVYLGDVLYKDFWRESDRNQQFMLWMMHYINDHENGKNMMKAMSAEKMMQMFPLDIEPERYQRRVINEMERPYFGIKKISTSPDLYLPRQELFLRTALRQMPLDPSSEEGQVEVKRMEDHMYRESYRQKDLIDVWNPVWNPLLGKMRSIYGWDFNFGRDLVGGVLSSLEERRKAKQESEERRMRER